LPVHRDDRMVLGQLQEFIEGGTVRHADLRAGNIKVSL
jgi:hypothetical protein